jgi:hypothetical protein
VRLAYDPLELDGRPPALQQGDIAENLPRSSVWRPKKYR